VLAALALGKPVFCEKPLGFSAAESLQLAQAAESAGVANMVGYNYIRTPASQLARQIIESGEIGEIIHVAAEHVEDYLHDPRAPARGARARRRQRAPARWPTLARTCSTWPCAWPARRCAGGRHEYRACAARDPHGMEAVGNDDQGNVMLRFASARSGPDLQPRGGRAQDGLHLPHHGDERRDCV
jgi:predicted dehydrogenase